jgi:hypothetical protein
MTNHDSAAGLPQDNHKKCGVGPDRWQAVDRSQKSPDQALRRIRPFLVTF